MDDDQVEPRLVEALAMALCWAEFAAPQLVQQGPAEYWQQISERARGIYRKAAEPYARAMAGGRFALVPLDASEAMVRVARAVRPALRADAHAHDVWGAMVREGRIRA